MLDTMLSADSLNKLSIKLCSEQTNLREVFKCDKVYGFTTIVLDLYSLDNSLAGESRKCRRNFYSAYSCGVNKFVKAKLKFISSTQLLVCILPLKEKEFDKQRQKQLCLRSFIVFLLCFIQTLLWCKL